MSIKTNGADGIIVVVGGAFGGNRQSVETNGGRNGFRVASGGGAGDREENQEG